MSEYTQLKEQMNEIDDLNGRIAELEAQVAKLREAAQAVADAWSISVKGTDDAIDALAQHLDKLKAGE